MSTEEDWEAEQREYRQHIADELRSNGQHGDEPTRADQLRFAMLHGAAIENVPPPEPLIVGWLDLESLAVLYGRPKSGKSFVALDLALCVATGSWWHGSEALHGDVVYVVAEGLRGIGPRVKAWRYLNRYDAPADRVHWLPRAVNLLDREWSAALAQACADHKPALVILDTLNRSMPGGDENTSRDMGQFIDAADQIKRHTGACVLVVHHSGKDATAGARGHSSLLGALDTEIECKNAGDGIIILTNTAQKDHAETAPLRLTLAAAADSVAIARWAGRTGPDAELPKSAETALASLIAIALPTGIPTKAWETKAIEDGVSHGSFYAARKALLERGLVLNIGTDKVPKYRPIDEADQAPDEDF